jgi:hypothetical protein
VQQGAKDKTCSIQHLHRLPGPARRSRKLSRCPPNFHCEGDVDIIFRIANETREVGSQNFPLALRRLTRRAPIRRTESAGVRTSIPMSLQASFDPRCDLKATKKAYEIPASGFGTQDLVAMRHTRFCPRRLDFSRFETAAAQVSRIRTPKCLKSSKLAIVPNWHPPCIKKSRRRV